MRISADLKRVENPLNYPLSQDFTPFSQVVEKILHSLVILLRNFSSSPLPSTVLSPS